MMGSAQANSHRHPNRIFCPRHNKFILHSHCIQIRGVLYCMVHVERCAYVHVRNGEYTLLSEMHAFDFCTDWHYSLMFDVELALHMISDYWLIKSLIISWCYLNQMTFIERGERERGVEKENSIIAHSPRIHSPRNNHTTICEPIIEHKQIKILIGKQFIINRVFWLDMYMDFWLEPNYLAFRCLVALDGLHLIHSYGI